MKLSFNQIKEISTGCARVEEENGFVNFYRFTKEQEELYKMAEERFYDRTFTTAGVKLFFKTDTKKLSLKIAAQAVSTRKFFSVDVFVDGKINGCIDNFSDTELPLDYTLVEFPLGSFRKEFHLGEGIKTVCIHFPWSMRTSVEAVEIDDGSFVEAVKPPKKLLAFGDSITQGHDALRPSNRYVALLAEKLGAEEFNKGIGGEKFFPPLAKTKDSFVPDYITVAYGTNDWNAFDKETFKERCKGFYDNLTKTYPESKIFAITPIWRKDISEEKPFGAFSDIERLIRECVKEYENITLISGIGLVPESEKFYGDLWLYPNDAGFEHYAENLYGIIKEEI